MKFVSFATTIALLLQQNTAVSTRPTHEERKLRHNTRRVANVLRPERHSRQHTRGKKHHSPPADEDRNVGSSTPENEASPPADAKTLDRQWSFLDAFSSPPNTDKPPCPSKEDMDAMGLTIAQLDCDPNVEALNDGVAIAFDEDAPAASPSLEGFEDDFFGGNDDFGFFFNFTPPCPPQEVLTALNVTVDDLGCDTEWLPPCPPQNLVGRLGMNETMDCDPDFAFFDDLFFNGTDDLPCPTDDALFELEAFFGFTCNPNATWPNGTWFDDFNYTTIECEAPVTCGLWGGEANGIVVCPSFNGFEGANLFDDAAAADGEDINWSVCVLPTEAFEGDTCGCCGGECPKPCTGSKCKIPYTSLNATGVWVADVEHGFAQCVSESESVTLQLEGFSTCLDACSA